MNTTPPPPWTAPVSCRRDCTTVKSLLQRLAINRAMCTDDHDPCPRRTAAPSVSQRDLHALSDDLKNRAACGRVGTVDDALAAIDAHRKPRSYFRQCIERQQPVSFIAPGTERPRMVVVARLVARG